MRGDHTFFLFRFPNHTIHVQSIRMQFYEYKRVIEERKNERSIESNDIDGWKVRQMTLILNEF